MWFLRCSAGFVTGRPANSSSPTNPSFVFHLTVIRIRTYKKRLFTDSHIYSPAEKNPTEYILEQIANLTTAQRIKFMSLSHLPNIPEKHIPFSIMQTNAFAAGESMAIFPEAARLNHACAGAFNVVYNWRENEETLCE